MRMRVAGGSERGCRESRVNFTYIAWVKERRKMSSAIGREKRPPFCRQSKCRAGSCRYSHRTAVSANLVVEEEEEEGEEEEEEEGGKNEMQRLKRQ